MNKPTEHQEYKRVSYRFLGEKLASRIDEEVLKITKELQQDSLTKSSEEIARLFHNKTKKLSDDLCKKVISQSFPGNGNAPSDDIRKMVLFFPQLFGQPKEDTTYNKYFLSQKNEQLLKQVFQHAKSLFQILLHNIGITNNELINRVQDYDADFLYLILTQDVSSVLAAKLASIRKSSHRPTSLDFFYIPFGTTGEEFSNKFSKKYFNSTLENWEIPLFEYFHRYYRELVLLDEFLEKQNLADRFFGKKYTLEQKKKINTILLELIESDKSRGLPFALQEDTQLCRETTYLQYEEGFEDTFNLLHRARVILYPHHYTEEQLLSPTTFKETRPYYTSRGYVLATLPGSINLAIEKFSGELCLTNVRSKGVRMLLGEEKYELLKLHLLFHLAEYTVDKDLLIQKLKYLVPFPEQRKNQSSKQETKIQTSATPTPTYYPKIGQNTPTEENEVNADDGIDTEEKTPISIKQRIYFKRLLPVKHKPSIKAIELSKASGVKLSYALWHPETGKRVKYWEVEEEKIKKNATEEDILHSYFENGYQLRYYTFVQATKSTALTDAQLKHTRGMIFKLLQGE